MNKTAIKNFAIWARNKLIADIQYRAGLMGITAEEIKQPLPQSTGETQFFDIGTAEPYSITGEAIKQRASLVSAIQRKEKETDYAVAYKYIIESVAYTWFNRLIAVRFMEINDYLPSHIRVLSSETGKMEPDLVTTPFDADLPFTDAEKQEIIRLKSDNQLDECFRLLFIKQCNALNEILPALFEKTSDYTEILLNISAIDKEGVVYHLVNDIPEDDFNIEKGGQVEIIGWMYQYYNTEPKNEAFAKSGKITKEEIPAVTQLFTPDWIVRYMVENSLGRIWVEGHTNDSLKANWKYFLEEAEQEPEVQEKLNDIHAEYAKLSPEDIHFIDPCMGSGHILVYAFDVLMQIYESAGYSERDAARSILENNLYGLDIDDRAYQMAYFAVMMKARQYNRRILSAETPCHVYSIQDSNNINRNQLKYFGADLSEFEKNNAMNQITGLLETFTDAKEYGSILDVQNYDWELLRRFVSKIGMDGQISFDTFGIEETQAKLKELVNIGETMAMKYEVVVTNPPYMGGSGMNPRLTNYIRDKYFAYKADLFSVFMYKWSSMLEDNGFAGFLSPFVWMFIQTYEKLREYIYKHVNLQSLIQFEYSAFEEATVPICSFVLQQSSLKKKGSFIRLTNFKGGMKVQQERTLEAISNKQCGFYYEKYTKKFEKIPGSPLAYWLGDKIFEYYENCNVLSNDIFSQVGTTLGDNAKFMRIWFEIEKSENLKWFITHKGGSYRRWYGNVSFVVNWENEGKAVKDYGRATVRGEKTAFDKGISWTQLTAGNPSFRIKEQGSFVESASCMCRIKDELYEYLLGYLNTKIVTFLLDAYNPTMHFQPGDIGRLPWKIDAGEIDKISILVNRCIEISKDDWNCFENSIDFKCMPLVLSKDDKRIYEKHFANVESLYDYWEAECNNRFNQLKANEEELNRIFIDIYGLQDELTPEVEDKDVTVRKADLQRDIKSLLSYAVGCMFGRYSLDEEGLAYAGGEWDPSKYTTYIPDDDNIIPITDEEYFEDDIIGLLCAWLKKVYGPETLEQNLDFIAKALGKKGDTSREIIRNYFVSDFFKDHCQTYSVTGSGKRPIYWLFDSGKQNGFKALIYLHRYNADTIGNLRVDYLHRMQRVYESEINRMQDMIDHSTNSREVGAATKRKEKLQKQLKECRDYDEKIAHLALARTELDLDDGVKYNYRKVQLAQDGKFYEVLADSKAIMMDEKKFKNFKK